MTADLRPCCGVIEGSIHRYALRVFYEDTDAGGVVYHANYLRWMERARSDLVDLLGIDQARALADGTGLYTVAEVAIRYRIPARLGESVIVETRASAVGRVSCVLEQRVLRGDQVLVEATVKIGFITPAGKPVRQPQSWQDAFATLTAPSAPPLASSPVSPPISEFAGPEGPE